MFIHALSYRSIWILGRTSFKRSTISLARPRNDPLFHFAVETTKLFQTPLPNVYTFGLLLQREVKHYITLLHCK